MIFVKNNVIPFKGFAAVTLWPFVFVRKSYADKVSVKQMEILKTHESIHGKQQLEMLIIPFLLWYGIEWIIRLFMGGNAYRNISFEREAYTNEWNTEYLSKRKFWAWVEYLKK